MGFIVRDRIRDTTTTTSTGTITVTGTAPIGHKTFSTVLAVNDTFPYCIAHQTLDEWEVGIGTYSAANQFTRTTIIASSNTNAVVNFSAGTKDVFITFYGSPYPVLPLPGQIQNATLVESHVSSAATFNLKNRLGNDPSGNEPVIVCFNDNTSMLITAALAITIPSTALMGSRSAIPFRLWFVLINDGGTPRLGVRNCVTTAAAAGSGSKVNALIGFPMTGILSSTVMSTTSDVSVVTYTDVAVTSKPFAILGYADYDTGQTTAGTWAASPTRIVLFGNNAIARPGERIQTVASQDGSNANGSTIMPCDGSIPQNTEGSQFQSVSLTPFSIQNVIDVRAQAIFQTNTADNGVAYALFTGSGNAQAGVGYHLPGVDNAGFFLLTLAYTMFANTISAITFTARAGGDSAATITFNPTNLCGGVNDSFIEAVEVMG